MNYGIHYAMYLAAVLLALFGHSPFAVVLLCGAIIVHHQSHLEGRRQEQGQRREQEQRQRENESFKFALFAPSEHGWHDIILSPAKKRYEESHCYGGPPTSFSLFEYDIRVRAVHHKVFCRLVDRWSDDLSGVSYDVINGAICGDARAKYLDGDLEKQIAWHELAGPEKYFILSMHGVGREFLTSEQKRLREGLAKVKADSEALGAIQLQKNDGIRYEAPQNASEEQKAAIKAGVAVLLSDESLGRDRVSLREVYDEDEFIYVLTELLRKEESCDAPHFLSGHS